MSDEEQNTTVFRKGKKSKSFSEPKPKAAPEVSKKWYELYCILANSGDKILESLIKRPEGISEDVKELLRGVLCLREARHLVFCEGDSISPGSLEIFTEALKEWSKSK
jgi:hypothetical protein